MSEVDSSRMVRAALGLACAIERDAVLVLSRASRSILAPDDLWFAALAEQLRKRGVTRSRRWSGVLRFWSDGSAAPAGEYIRVRFDVVSELAPAGEELITLRHDEDDVWRLAGYAMQ